MAADKASEAKDLALEDLLELVCDLLAGVRQTVLDPGFELDVETKSNRNDLVTAVDKRIEAYISEELVAATGYPLLGEEGHSVSSFAGRVWVLDPIDGTMNYVTTHRDYAISLALCEDGRPVLGVVVDVVAGLTYTAIAGQGAYCDWQPLARVNETRGRREVVIITDIKEIVALPRLTRCLLESRGHRRYGSAALECVEVAAGRAGAFVHMWVSPWDIAAAYLICVESGVTFTRLDGTPLDVRYPGSVLVGWPQAHTELLSALMRQVE